MMTYKTMTGEMRERTHVRATFLMVAAMSLESCVGSELRKVR